MIPDLLSFALSAAIALAVAFPLGSTLKRHPVPFYLLAFALVGIYELFESAMRPTDFAVQILAEPFRKGYLASCLLAVVMFTGTLAHGSNARRRLQPIRAELSILSCIGYVPHVLTFLPSYLPRFGALVQAGNLMSASLVVAVILLAIYIVLSVLSLRMVRAQMPHRVWKGIQRLSYLMVALLVAHIWLAVGRSALAGAQAGMRVALTAYTAVALLYAVLRIRRAWLDHAQGAPQSSVAHVSVEAEAEAVAS